MPPGFLGLTRHDPGAAFVIAGVRLDRARLVEVRDPPMLATASVGEAAFAAN